MQLEKSGGRFPITAVEVWEVSEAEIYLIWGTGPYFCFRPWQSTSNDNVKFIVSDCDSVHNIRCFTSSLVVAAFGGKSLAIARKQVDGLHLQCKFAQLDDLVLDFALRGECSDPSSPIDCYIGYAHNFVDIATITASGEYLRQSRVQCSDISVLFHMAFSMDGSREGLTVASGTVFGKIILWRVDSTAATSNILCRADDHEGVIFRIKWSEDKSKLVSVADDRTVRMWRIAYQDSNSSLPSGLELVFTAWGHVSRVWDVVFLRSAPDTDIATCSEDGTVKLWSAEGVCMSTMRGHSHHVWRLAAVQQGALLISGGNDASIKVWDVAYQRRACPEDTISSVSLAPIPDWPPAIDPVEPAAPTIAETIGTETAVAQAGQESEETVDELPQPPSKKKASVASRRANGVCSVQVSPCLRYVVVVLVEGGVWLVRVAPAESGAESEWVALTHLRAIVSTMDASFVDSNEPNGALRVRLAVALLNGSNTLLTITVPSSGPPATDSRYDWRAHEMRTVNVWLSDSADSISRFLVTATVKGVCSVWHIGDDSGPREICACALPSQAIATASLVARCPRLRSEYLVLGDARGSVYVYNLPVLESGGSVVELSPAATFAKVHGTDPVSCIAQFESGFVTAGHDGMLHVYTEVVNQATFSCGMTAVPTEASLGWAHTGKINCLPITTPDQVFVAAGPESVSSIYVCGYHGSVFMVVDVRQGYQLLRVEGGGWKRPHRCAVQTISDGRALVRGLPACLFVCPAPLLKSNTALQLFGGFPNEAHGAVTSTLPVHLGCAGMGRVGYCAAFITASDPSDDSITPPLESSYVVVGGEDSCVKVYSVPELALVQEVSLSMNSRLKALCSATSQAAQSRGILVGAGGKLQYYVWMFDRSVGCSGRSALGDVLFTGAEGSTWAKATQDHRILSVHCAYLGSSLRPQDASTIAVYVERYAVLLCDSRGVATVGHFEHSLLGSAGVPVRSFSVLQQVQASQCPLLSCSLLLGAREGGREASAPLLAVVGDTAGTVSVWKIAAEQSNGGDGITEAAAQVVQFAAHAMGANALSCCAMPGGKVGIFSAGDDQALSCAVIDVEAEGVVTSHAMVQGASGSAIKGLKIVHNEAGVVSLAAVGYDQRLYVWEVNCERGDAPAVKWVCGSPVNVSDVGCVDVGILPGGARRVCGVVGEGVQLFALSS